MNCRCSCYFQKLALKCVRVEANLEHIQKHSHRQTLTQTFRHPYRQTFTQTCRDILSLLYRPYASANSFLSRRLYTRLRFDHQHCHNSCLLCCVIHPWISHWCCGALLYCEEEIRMPKDLLHDIITQGEEATVSTCV